MQSKVFFFLGSILLCFYQFTYCMYTAEQRRNNAHRVAVFYACDLGNEFSAGHTSLEDRRRLREQLMDEDDNPFSRDAVSQQSFAQLIRHMALRHQQGRSLLN